VITPKNVKMEEIQGIPSSVLDSWRGRGLTWKTAQEVGFPDNLIPGDNNNFGARLGAAIRLSRGFILRVGYGEYYWTMPLSQILQTSRTNPPLNLRFTNAIADQNGAVPFYALKSVRGRTTSSGRPSVDTNGIIILSSNSQSMMPGSPPAGRTTGSTWHFTVEREIAGHRSAAVLTGNCRDPRAAVQHQRPRDGWNYQARTGVIRPSVADLRRVNHNLISPPPITGYSNNHAWSGRGRAALCCGSGVPVVLCLHARSSPPTSAVSPAATAASLTQPGRQRGSESIQIIGAPNLSYDDRLKLTYYNSREVAQRIRYNTILHAAVRQR
jgi:hypothetical protein